MIIRRYSSNKHNCSLGVWDVRKGVMLQSVTSRRLGCLIKMALQTLMEYAGCISCMIEEPLHNGKTLEINFPFVV